MKETIIREISKTNIVIENIDENISYANKVMKSIGITEFITCQVDHCNQSYGVAITINNNHNFDVTVHTL